MKLEHFPSAMSPQDQEFNCNDQSQKEKNNQNHDQWHRATSSNLKLNRQVSSSGMQKGKNKHHMNHTFFVIQVKGSTIIAKILSDRKPIFWDASKFKIETRSTDDDEARTLQLIQAPPATSNQQAGLENGNPEDNLQAEPELQLRWSARTQVSMLDRHLRDYDQQ